MNIAILGSVNAIIPPTGQAAIERLAYDQALGLAKRGHKILLFAPRGSAVPHENVTIVEVATTQLLSGKGNETDAPEKIYGSSYKLRLEFVNTARVIQELYNRKDHYDIVINNLRGEGAIWETARQLEKPLFHIMHLPLFPELLEISAGINLVSISRNQQKQFPNHAYAGIVYNAVNTDELAFNPTPKNYVLYLGSIGENKNPHDAVIAALKAGVPIKLGGRIKDQHYFDTQIKPYIDNDKVQWVGEITRPEIIKLYQEAKAFLFPTLWDEPFGLVATEALSCGTPVIAYPNGALPEIVEHGVNGYLVKSPAEMAQKVKEIDQIKRKACRDTVLNKFSIVRMIDGLENIITKK